MWAHNIFGFLVVSLPFLLVPMLIAMTDFLTLIRVKFKKEKTGVNFKKIYPSYSILIPIFGDMKYLKNVDYLKTYGNKVFLCTTTRESKKFNIEIETIAKQNGFNVFRSEVALTSSKAKPNPWKLFQKTLHGKTGGKEIVSDLARDEIIRDSFKVVDGEICILLDGDTTSRQNLDILVGVFSNKKYDIASVRVLASKENTLAEKLQSIEYRLAMDARRIYPWLTSGASMVAKTSVIQTVMQHHSLFFSGGDIEIGKLSRLLGYKVGHLPFIFYTDVPETFKAWVKQRRAWFGGGFRHAIVNFYSFTWRHPLFYLYTTFIVYGLTPVRWYEAIEHPEIIPLVITVYWIILFVFHWKYWKWYYFIFPIYALFQVMIILPMGVYTYLKMAYTAKNIGLISLKTR